MPMPTGPQMIPAVLQTDNRGIAPRYGTDLKSKQSLIQLCASFNRVPFYRNSTYNSTDSTIPSTLTLPAGVNLEFLSLDSLSVKVVTECLQQGLSQPPNSLRLKNRTNHRDRVVHVLCCALLWDVSPKAACTSANQAKSCQVFVGL